MKTRAALTATYERVRDFFAANTTPGVYGAFVLGLAQGPGEAAFTPGATSPAADYDAVLRFDVGGTVGTAGIMYSTSLNGGAYFTPSKPLGTAHEIAIYNAASGVTVELGTGTVPTGQLVTFTTETARRAAKVLFGWHEYTKQVNQSAEGANRIVFIPGDGIDGGREGEFTGPRSVGPHDVIPPPPKQPDTDPSLPPGQRARHLFDWMRTSTVSVWGVDPARPNDDAASYEVVDRLVEDLLQALQKAPPYGISGLYRLGAPSWAKGQLDQLFGRELLIPLSLKATLFDIPAPTVTPAAGVNRNPPD